MIRVICEKCQSQLDAKDELLGQVRKCPRCQNPVTIVPVQEKDIPATPEIVSDIIINEVEGLKPGRFPSELDFRNKYCICSNDSVVAIWELGKGWSYKAGQGFVNAAKNRDIIPEKGDYTLVEIVVRESDDAKRPCEVNAYRLNSRWALPEIASGNDAILAKIQSESQLSSNQKNFVLDYLKTVYMPDFLYQSKELIRFLRDDDTESQS